MNMLVGSPKRDLIITVKHRLSFAYVEYARVQREANSIIARNAVEDVDLPVANLAALILGTGSSITQEAVGEVSRWGCNITFTMGGGLGVHAAFVATSSRSSYNLSKQARIHSDPKMRLAAARRMYSLRWGRENVPKNVSIRHLMRVEGSRMKRVYREQAQRVGLSDFSRVQRVDFSGDDRLNQFITAGNHVLYGLANAVIVSLGLSPGLGVIHNGNARAFVFDIADLYKEQFLLPLAFDLMTYGAEVNEMRRSIREQSLGLKLIPQMVNDIYYCLQLDSSEDSDDEGVNLLWSDEGEIDHGGNNMGESS